MFQKRGYVDHNLIKIKDKLAEASGTRNLNDKGASQDEDNAGNSSQQSPAEPVHVQIPAPKIAGSSKASVSALKNETKAVLAKRKDEFRLSKRDICGKLSEKLSAFPEDIRITERKIEELKNAIEKFATLIDELKAVDEHNWDENTAHSDIGRACRKAENARLEYIRICSRLSALQRESFAAEDCGDTKSGSILHEFSSISLKQGLKIGLFVSIPVICAIIFASLIIAIAYILALKL